MKARGRNLFIMSLTLCMSLAALTACGSENSGSNDASANTAQVSQNQSGTTAVKETGDKFKGKLNCILQDETLSNNSSFIVEKLQSENPDLKINLEVSPVSNIDQKINMAHASGQDYDFISVNNSSVQQFYAGGVLEPLDGYLEKSGISLKDNYSQSLLDVGIVDGKQYAIPQSPDCRVLAYNKKLIEAGGLSAPKTQEDILNISKALAKNGIYAYARQMNSLSPVYNEGCFMLADGAQICKDIDGKITAACNTPEMIGQIEFWKEMAPYMPKDINYSDDQIRSMFAQGKILFYIYGPWEINNTIDKQMKFGVDYDLMPVPGKVKNGSVSGGFYIGVGAGSKNKEAAWAYIEESLKPESICKLAVTLPADNRCYQMPPYNQDIYKPFIEAYKTATPPMPYSANFNKITDIFFDYYNKALIGGEDAAQMMEKCNSEIEKQLNE